VNLHLKFPFSVLGGVLVIPTWEEVGSKAAKTAEKTEEAIEEEDIEDLVDKAASSEEASSDESSSSARRSTVHLIERAITRLIRAGGRKTEGDAAHLLEGIAVVVYDPDAGILHPDLPKANSGLRWDEFIKSLADAYKARFED
jgi:hypothetical protein